MSTPFRQPSRAAELLAGYIERIEDLESRRRDLGADVREVYAEAKLEGFDPKVLRQVVQLRKLEEADRQERHALLQLYLEALGMAPADGAAGRE